ncbi:hypothetical protein G5714_000010 [Onychostoma macrolepis]|uniref:Uncharacterized protein n=1 Tax=Onychostoma macrolepis TaxID=369639 RepID=A0A7J6DFD1_9TELE|nr:hypothetical protein G5714_000010 [Onychostoma macrolepis]
MVVETNDVEHAALGPYWVGGFPVRHFQGHIALGYQGGDVLLRDQFVMGLREGPIQQELRAQVRRDRQLTFEDVRKEALALESERQDLWAPSTPVFTQNVAVEPVADWS